MGNINSEVQVIPYSNISPMIYLKNSSLIKVIIVISIKRYIY